MSGGFFNYNENRINEIVEQLDEVLNGKHGTHSKSVLNKIEFTKRRLIEAHAYIRFIDLLLSGDIGDDSFHTRLGTTLEELRNANII
jgi:hypothetical protein